MTWRVVDYEFDRSETVYVRLHDGRKEIELLAELELDGRRAIVRGLHVLGGGANTMGVGELRRLLVWAKGYLDVDHLRIEGATRTSGAGPGRLPPGIDA